MTDDTLRPGADCRLSPLGKLKIYPFTPLRLGKVVGEHDSECWMVEWVGRSKWEPVPKVYVESIRTGEAVSVGSG